MGAKSVPERVFRGYWVSSPIRSGAYRTMWRLGLTCVAIMLTMSRALAISPEDAFEELAESASLEECLAQPDEACVFELAVAAAIESRNDDYLRDGASVQASTGFFERALYAASKIDKYSIMFPWALADIAVEQASAGLVEEARQTADAVWRAPWKNQLWYIRSMCAIASAQARAGDEASRMSLSEAIEIAEKSERSELYAIGRAWRYIVEARLDVDGLDGAQESLESMRRTKASAWWLVLALNDVAMAQASAGHESQALDTFSEARRLAREMESSYYLSRVAAAQTISGFLDEARHSFRAALDAAGNLQNTSTRIDVLTEVSQAQREVGLHAEASATAKAAIETAHARVEELTAIKSEIFEAEVKIARAMRDLAAAQLFAGLISDAETTVQEIYALSEVDYFSGLYYAWAMAELAVAQWRSGRENDAAVTMGAAVESARKFDFELDRRGKGHWYSIEVHWYRVAVAMATMGKIEGALRIGEQHEYTTRFHIFQAVMEVMSGT